MPRNIRTTPPLLRALRGLEESSDLAQVRFAEVRERRHRRALVHAARALEVVDLEGDALLLRALGAQVRRAELRAADAEVGVAVEAARRGEEQGAGFGLGRQLLLLDPPRNRCLELGAEGFLGSRALVREHAHRE